MLFDYRLDVESHLNRIVELVKSPDSKNILNLNLISKNISKAIDKYLKKYSIRISPEKLAILREILDNFDSLHKEQDISKINKIITRILELYEKYNLFPATYLLRHPEKFSAGQIGPESAEQRALTKYGVRQAKEFADFLIEEMLVTNIPIRLVINFSPYKRTRLFAEIIKLKSEWIKNHFGKNISIVFSKEDLISGDQVKTGTDSLDGWVKSKNAKETSALVQDWFSSKSGYSRRYTINIGVTHLPNLVAFLVHNLGLSYGKTEKFKYADFIKFENSKYYYDGKWQ